MIELKTPIALSWIDAVAVAGPTVRRAAMFRPGGTAPGATRFRPRRQRRSTKEMQMGLLDQMMGGGHAQRRPGLGDTVAAGVVLALLVKAIRAHQAHQASAPAQGRSFDPAAQAQAQGGGMGGGGLLGGLGGLLGGGGGGLGGLLGGLGGAGALGSLIGRFQQNGYGQQVQSWVSPGPNQSIAPEQVGQVLGEDTLNQLQQQTGLPRHELLAQIAHELPEAINQATPAGRAPSDDELHELVRGGTPGAS
jgi:uncharacterized protein YidB (DUF937 family)